MRLLLESVRVEHGQFEHLELHLERMNLARRDLFGLPPWNRLELPTPPSEGLFKCRIVYGPDIRSVEFRPYAPPSVRSLRLVRADSLDYAYKWLDRSELDRLRETAADCDDILIVKDGLLTDASFANIVVEKADGTLLTPRRPLLQGVRRRLLLASGRVREADLAPSDLSPSDRIHLVNAMLDLTTVVVKGRNILR